MLRMVPLPSKSRGGFFFLLSSEHPVQIPAEVAGAGIDAVAAAVEPEALAFLGLDLEIVAHRLGLGHAPPPFAVDALGAVGAGDAMVAAAPGEAAGRLVREQGDDLFYPLGRRKQADWARPGGPGGDRSERAGADGAALRHVA